MSATFGRTPFDDVTIGSREDTLLVSAEVFAEMMQVSERTLWRWLSACRVPEPVRIGGTVRWRHLEIKNWIARGCPPLEGK